MSHGGLVCCATIFGASGNGDYSDVFPLREGGGFRDMDGAVSQIAQQLLGALARSSDSALSVS